MPIYEFHSPDTNKIYSFFARSLAYANKIPRCPDDPNARMERVVSKFAFTGRAKEKSETPAGDDMDPRMERVMAEMERDMAGMDENHPDPPGRGRSLRKMYEGTGKKIPGAQELKMPSLECGAVPRTLER